MSNPSGKPLRLDARLFSLPDDTVYLCLPYWFRSALLSLTERMLWSRVWLDDDETYVLSSEDVDRIEYGIWKLSQDDCGCEESGMIDDILKRIEELENMNINNYVNCGCGCGCGSSEQLPENDLLPNDPPLAGAEPPDDDEGVQPPSGNKCSRANWMYDQILTTLRLVATTNTRESYIYNLSIQYGITLAMATQSVPFAMFSVLLGYLARTTLALVEETLVELKDAIVCALYSSQSVKGARLAVGSVVGTATNPYARLALLVINQIVPYSTMFEVGREIPSRYNSMPCCGSVPDVFPELPDDGCEEYYLTVAAPVSITPGGSPPNAQLTYSAATGLFTFTPLQLQQNNHLVTMVLDFDALPDDVFGFLIEFSSTIYGDTNNGMGINSLAGGNYDLKTDHVYYSASLAGTDSCYDDYTNSLNSAIAGTRYNGWSTTAALTNGPKSTFTFKTAGTGSAAQSFSGRILVICKRP